mmetsp:Transcript_16933/g.40384  ORF Transcript_16933/g.40384 Transcript_16933/m.40384 type:complete len:708 (-) Transcript_16933:349-2472(-)
MLGRPTVNYSLHFGFCLMGSRLPFPWPFSLASRKGTLRVAGQEWAPGPGSMKLQSSQVGLVAPSPPVSHHQAFSGARSCIQAWSPKADHVVWEPFHTAALSCIGAALSTRQPVPALVQELGLSPQAQGKNLPAPLLRDLAKTATSASSIVRIEALGAMRGALRNYPETAQGAWVEVAAVLDGNLGDSRHSRDHPLEHKAMQLALRVLESFLQAASGLVGSPDENEERQTAPAGTGRAGDPLTSPGARSTHPCGLGLEERSSCWRTALARWLPRGQGHPSAMVRAAAHAVVSRLDRETVASLGSKSAASLLASLTHAIACDTEAAVRAAACRALGTLAAIPEAMQPEVLSSALACLSSGMLDPSLSVRIPAAWGSANICALLAEPNFPAALGQQLDGILDGLAGNASLACRDNEKVRAHGVRALGNLFALVGHGVAVAGASPSWIPSSVQFVMAALETGSVKVQWNACCAANALFRSQVAAAMEPVRAQIPAILAQLLALAQECQNLKIRTHAVGALMALSRRGDFGDTYCNAVKVITEIMVGEIMVLEGTEWRQQSRTDNALLDFESMSNSDVSDRARQHTSQADIPHQASFRRRCQATLLHLLAMAEPSDIQGLVEAIESHRKDVVSFVHAALASLDKETKIDSKEQSDNPMHSSSFQAAHVSKLPIYGLTIDTLIEEPPIFSLDTVACANRVIESIFDESSIKRA